MKNTFRFVSLLLALIVCCSAFFACSNPNEKTQPTQEAEAESKEPNGSYKLLYRSNRDGTCYVYGIEVSEDAANLTLVIPELSPDGEKVTGYHTDALSFANLPMMLLKEDFIAYIDTPMKQAVEEGKISEFLYHKIVYSFFLEKSLANEKTELAKETMLMYYPITAVADIYEFAPDATEEELAMVSRSLAEYIGYTSKKNLTCIQNLVQLARQNDLNYTEYLPVNADAFVAISLPDSLESINSYAFFGCTAAVGNVVDGVIYFGNEKNPYLMLHGAEDKEITSLIMPETTKFISDYAFSGCEKLESVSIPEGVKVLGNSVFSNCRSLKSVFIPDGVTSIGRDAFFFCLSLSEVVMPKSVVSIDRSAFDKSKLSRIYYAGTAEDWAKIEIDESNEFLSESAVYYYSEAQPTGAGNYWRYVEGVPTAW